MTGPPDAYASIRRAVLDAVEEAKLDPRSDTEAVRALVVKAVDGYQRAAHAGTLPAGGMALSDPAVMGTRIPQAICDFGPRSSLFGRSDVEETFSHGHRGRYLVQGGRLRGLAAPTTRPGSAQGP